MENLLGLGVFGTFGQPYGFQQAFSFDVEFSKSLDLDNEEIALFPGTELYSVKREFVNGVYSIAFCLYAHAREMNANRNGTFIGSAIVLQQVYVDPNTIYKLLRELHDDIVNNAQNLSNNTIQVRQAVNLNVKEPAQFQTVKFNTKTIENTPYYSTKINPQKKFFIHPGSVDNTPQVVRFFDEALKSYKDAETLYFSFSDKISHYVNKKAAIKVIEWDDFTSYRDGGPKPPEMLPSMPKAAPLPEKPVQAVPPSAPLLPAESTTVPLDQANREELQKMVDEYDKLIDYSKQMRDKLDSLLAKGKPAVAESAGPVPAAPAPVAVPEPAPVPKPAAEPVPAPAPKPVPAAEPVPIQKPEPTPLPEPPIAPKPEPAVVPPAEPKPEPAPRPTPNLAPPVAPRPEPAPAPPPPVVPKPEPAPAPKPAPVPPPVVPKPEPAPAPKPAPAPPQPVVPEPEPAPTPKPAPAPPPPIVSTPEPTPAPKPAPAPPPPVVPKPEPAPAPKPAPAPPPPVVPKPAPAPTPKPAPVPPKPAQAPVPPKPEPKPQPAPKPAVPVAQAPPYYSAKKESAVDEMDEEPTPFYKKKGVIIGLVLILVIGGAGAAYMYKKHSSKQTETWAASTTDSLSMPLSHDSAANTATAASAESPKPAEATATPPPPEPAPAKAEEKPVEKPAEKPAREPIDLNTRKPKVAKETTKPAETEQVAEPRGKELNPRPNGELSESEVNDLNQFGIKNMFLSELTAMIMQKFPSVGNVYEHQAKDYAVILMQANKGCFKKTASGYVCIADALHHIPVHK